MSAHLRRPSRSAAASSPAARDEGARALLRHRSNAARVERLRRASASGEVDTVDAGEQDATARDQTSQDGGRDAEAELRRLAQVETPLTGQLPVAKGARGEPARQVQQRLVEHGAAIDIDGVFGGQTEDMVRAFQHANGLAVSGVVDQTAAALLFSSQASGIDAARLDGVPGIAIGSFDTWESGERTGSTDVVLLDGVRLAAWVAPHWVAMRAAASADGVSLKFNSARSGFRTSDDQEALYRRYGSPRAVPAGWSNHQNGHAVDLVMTPDVKAWMAARAGEFGFVRPTYEEWHWEYRV